MHLFSLFTGWIIDLTRDFKPSNQKYNDFYKDIINGYFGNVENSMEILSELKSSTMLYDNIMINAEKRLKEIIVVVGYINAVINGDNYSVAVCLPLETEKTFIQESKHRVTVKKKFSSDRIAFLSLNRLHVDESLISPSIRPDCFELMLLTLYLNQSKGVHGIKRYNNRPRYNLRNKTGNTMKK